MASVLAMRPTPDGAPAVRPALLALGLLALTGLLVPAFYFPKGALLFVALGILAAAVWLVCQPHWGVLVILLFWFLEINPIGIRYLSIPYVVAAILMIPLAAALLREGAATVWQVPQIKLFLAIGLVLLASTGWSNLTQPTTPLPALDATARQLHLFVTRLGFLVFFIHFVRTPRHVGYFMLALVVMIAVAAADGLHYFAVAGGAERAHSRFGLTENSNRLAFASLFAASTVWFYRAYAPRPRMKFLTFPLIAFFAAAALAAGSRSGFIQTLILAAFILKEQRGWTPARRLHSLAMLFGLVLIVLAVVPTTQLLRGTTFSPTKVTRGQQSLRDRMNTVYAAAEMSAGNPVLGIGVGNFRWMHQAHYGNDRETHNSYLWALTGGGVPLLALYLTLFATTYGMVRRAERAGPLELLWAAKALRVNLILFLLFSAFADFWLSEFLYVLVGLVVALAALASQQTPALAVSRHRHAGHLRATPA